MVEPDTSKESELLTPVFCTYDFCASIAVLLQPMICNGGNAILVNHAEVAIGLAEYFFAWVRLEAKQDFEKRCCW